MINEPQDLINIFNTALKKADKTIPTLNPISEITKIEQLNNYDQSFKDLLIGILLGDASISKSSVNFSTQKARLSYRQSKTKNEEYINSIFEKFKKNGFISSKEQTKPKTEITKIGFKNSITKLYFATRYDEAFYQMYLKFYSDRKVIPKTIRQDLSEISLAYWFSDDGSRRNPTGTGFDLSTQAYSIYEVFVLCDVLRRKFNIMAWPLQEKAIDITRLKEQGFDVNEENFDKRIRYYKILISGSCFKQFKKLIYKYLQPQIRKIKWPTPKNPDGTATSRRITQVTQGRYIRDVDLSLKKANKVTVTEQILNFDLNKIEYETKIIISKNDILLYLEEYNKLPLLNSNLLFQGWD